MILYDNPEVQVLKRMAQDLLMQSWLGDRGQEQEKEEAR